MRHSIHTIIALCLLAPAACGDADKKAPTPDGKTNVAAKPDPTAESPAPAEGGEAEENEEAQLLAALDPKVLRATEIAENIERDPENSDEVLARSDLDREGLDALMYEIAINPELASQYRIARGLK